MSKTNERNLAIMSAKNCVPVHPVEVVDLFCGVGALSHGLKRAGLKIVAGYDTDEGCRFAYETNNNAKFYKADVSKLSAEEIQKHYSDNCFYIGALGSRKTHADRIAKLAGKGYIKPQLDRINGPVGLAIGSKSPAEIALSISAQLVATQRGAVQRIHKAA